MRFNKYIQHGATTGRIQTNKQNCIEIPKRHILIDEVGGSHEEGIGWNPQGVYCGECNLVTCKNCINEKEGVK